MTLPFAILHARRELRSSRRRVGVYMGAIALGVAALVAINSFRANVVAAVEAEGRALLGADLRLSSASPFPDPVRAVLDSAAATGAGVSFETRLASMVLAPAGGRTRLAQIRAVSGDYPYYGRVDTEPAGLWPLSPDRRVAAVDPAVLVQLDAATGDTLAIGEARVVIAGTVEDRTGEIAVQSAIGPRVYVPLALLEETGLIQVGSLVRYLAYLRFDEPAEAGAFVEAHAAAFRAHGVGVDTAARHAEMLVSTLGSVGGVLGLVALMALLLGGVGVASAIHVFMRERVTAVAVLRCLGATRRDVFSAYLFQSAALGLAGAAFGATAGIGVQLALPRLLASFLPLPVPFGVHWPAVFAGVLVGAWVALVFALLPLLAVRAVTPLQAIRRDFEPPSSRGDPWRWVAFAAIAASVLGLSLWQAPGPAAGLAFAGGIAVVLLVLAAAASALARAARRVLPRSAAFAARQGVANLFRPRNQTRAVTLALGFGVFLVATAYLVQLGLLERVRLDAGADRPNLVLFDIQQDQLAPLEALAAERGAPLRQVTPLVPARIAALNGRPVAELLEAPDADRPERWAVRREYRNTYRAALASTETLSAGSWWDADAGGRGKDSDANTGDRADGLPRISVEEGLAADLRIGVGDRITWDVQGLPIETRVANLRRVDWMRFAPNFFVVFEPGVLDHAPQSLIAVSRVDAAEARAALQRDIVRAFPNISALDLGLVQEAVDDVLGTVALAIRFLALFTLLGGAVVLVGALAGSRFQRIREVALLRTLGASRAQIRGVLLVEYLALGALAGTAGLLLAGLAAWALASRFLGLDLVLPLPALLLFWLAAPLLTAAVGFLTGRDVARRPPLAVLREASE